MELDLIENQIFSVSDSAFGQNVIVFAVDMSSSAHVDDKKGHFNSWKGSNTKIRTYTHCRKTIFD